MASLQYCTGKRETVVDFHVCDWGRGLGGPGNKRGRLSKTTGGEKGQGGAGEGGIPKVVFRGDRGRLGKKGELGRNLTHSSGSNLADLAVGGGGSESKEDPATTTPPPRPTV